MQYQYAENTAISSRTINVLGGSEINSIGAGVVGATIAGGGVDYSTGTDSPNIVNSSFGTIGGGFGNTSGPYATVGGGTSNTANGNSATVGGGLNNTASNFYATVAGGERNTASASYATVPGGVFNTASRNYATVGGGYFNVARGYASTVPGGYDNTAAGDYSFAAGRRAYVTHTGSFVWADSTNSVFGSAAVNQFSVRASGGVRIFTNSTLTAGVTLTAGDATWNSVSDRNAKWNFQDVNSLDVLERLLAMPLTTWNYKSRDDIRHMGVMAQDFYGAFGLGTDDKHISTVDADGVAFAAIQGLNRKLEAKEKRLAAVEAQNAALKAENAEMKARLDAIERTLAELKVNSK